MQKIIAVVYTSHAGRDWTAGKGTKRIGTISFDIDADDFEVLDVIAKAAKEVPFTRDEALYMSPTANALARLICALEELHGRHFLGSDQILDIAKA